MPTSCFKFKNFDDEVIGVLVAVLRVWSARVLQESVEGRSTRQGEATESDEGSAQQRSTFSRTTTMHPFLSSSP